MMALEHEPSRASPARAETAVSRARHRAEQLVQDVRFGARMLARNPGFAVTAVLTLALATGATTAIFSIVNSVLLRPLPFADAEQLVQVYGRTWRDDRGEGAPDPSDSPIASPELEAYHRDSDSFEALVGYSLATRHLQGVSGAERLTAVQADAGLFALLGVEPIAGRTFQAGDPLDVAVISAGLWRRRFDADPSLPGTTVTLDGRPFTVLGVMPEAFQFPYNAGSMMPGALPESRTDVWVPLVPLRDGAAGTLRRGRVNVVGRLKSGVTPEAATAGLRVIAARIQDEQQGGTGGTAVRVDVRLVPLADEVLAPVRRSLWMLFVAVGMVLVATCANVANLLLARVSARTGEVVTRLALGANRARLVRQFLVESLLLSVMGGIFGIVVARWGTSVLVRLGAARIPRAHEITLDWHTFAFLFTACVATAMMFGLAPALAAARTDVQRTMREGGGHVTPGRGHSRVRDGLVVAEVALAFVLGLGAALVIREVDRLRNVETGLATERVLTLHLTPRATGLEYRAIEERIAGLPGIEAAGFTQLLPLQNWGWEADFAIRGRVANGRPTAALRYVTPGYFRTLGIPIRRGRAFADSDRADAAPVILVNEALVRRYLPGEDPVGVELDRGTIIGVVGDVRQVRLDQPAEPELYYPVAQNVTMAPDIGMTLVVRTTGPPEQQIDPVLAAVRDVTPRLALFNVRTMDQVVADSLWELRLYRWIIGLFATLALVVAGIGLYGLIAYSVTSRMREFGIRLALGSDPPRLIRLVVAHAVRLTIAGSAAGIVVALMLTPSLQVLSAGLRADVQTHLVTAGVLLALALMTCIAPAVRVAAVDAAAVLRHPQG